MLKTALITGATDGIGKATALELAKEGYTIHVLGRNTERAEQVLRELSTLAPDLGHKYYIVDLAILDETKAFLAAYTQENSRLDLLFLNANVAPKKPYLSPDGIDALFSIGYLSRYLFAAKLKPLLEATTAARVIFNAHAGWLMGINYNALETANYGLIRSLGQCGSASVLLALHLANADDGQISYEVFHPGTVNTGRPEDRGLMTRLMMKVVKVLEPQEAGASIAKHIISGPANPISSGKFMHLDTPKPVHKALFQSDTKIEKLIAYSEHITQVILPLSNHANHKDDQ
jgi:NAD(P)-dependent dehydrogenase (short-subunit alcohol dehydrogenase family)